LSTSPFVQDRNNFLERLSKLVVETATACYGWVLMSNYAHFLFRTGDVGLSTLMRRLLTGYAASFNRRHPAHDGASFSKTDTNPLSARRIFI